MYCIRGLKTSMGKVAFPLGELATVGAITEDTTFTYVKSRLGGNVSDFLFNVHTDANNRGWAPVQGTFIALKVKSKADNKIYTKTVSLFPRRSNDGTLFPINTTQKFSLVFSSPPMWHEQQRFNASRNSTPYSAVNEVLIMQSKLSVQHHGWNKTSLVRVDPKFFNDDDTRGSLVNVIVEKDPLVTDDQITSTVGPDSSAGTMQLYSKTGTYMGVGGIVNSYRLLGNETGYYSSIPERPEDSLYGFDVGILSTTFLANKDDIGRFSIVVGGAVRRVSIPLTAELKAMLERGATRYTYVCFRFVAFMSKGTFTPRTPRTVTPREMQVGTWRHRSDFIPELTAVSPDGEFIVLTFDRASRVDIFFNDVGYGYNAVSDENNTIRINKADVSFTAGGLLRVVQKHDLRLPSENRTWNYVIPDTLPPDPPTATSFTKSIIYGTAYRGDHVYVKRGETVLGNTVALSTDVWELHLVGYELTENDELQIWTQDVAGNKSEEITVTVTGVREPVFLDTGFNGDVLSIADN